MPDCGIEAAAGGWSIVAAKRVLAAPHPSGVPYADYMCAAKFVCVASQTTRVKTVNKRCLVRFVNASSAARLPMELWSLWISRTCQRSLVCASSRLRLVLRVHARMLHPLPSPALAADGPFLLVPLLPHPPRLYSAKRMSLQADITSASTVRTRPARASRPRIPTLRQRRPPAQPCVFDGPGRSLRRSGRRWARPKPAS